MWRTSVFWCAFSLFPSPSFPPLAHYPVNTCLVEWDCMSHRILFSVMLMRVTWLDHHRHLPINKLNLRDANERKEGLQRFGTFWDGAAGVRGTKGTMCHKDCVSRTAESPWEHREGEGNVRRWMGSLNEALGSEDAWTRGGQSSVSHSYSSSGTVCQLGTRVIQEGKHY